jgi:hypothetical protein
MVAIVVALACTIDAPLNEKVVEFARSQLGQQVGNGQCSTLAVEALRYAGATWRSARNGVWGDEVKSLRDAQPGDILQFENAVFTSSQFRDDGALVTQQYSFPHHTAIIARVQKRGKKPVLVILHQNIGGGQVVQEWTIDMAHMRRGTVKLFRPVAE